VLLAAIGDSEIRDSANDLGYATVVYKPVKPALLLHELMAFFGAPAGEAEPLPEGSHIDPDMGSRHPLRILLAEDNLVNQKVALRMLNRIGYDADVVYNGVESLEAVCRQEYDVILMDVQMPEMDGLEATRRIRAGACGENGRPYIIAMTAAAMQVDKEKCLEAGMNDFVSKPARVEDLIEALQRYLVQVQPSA
jgi:CheY-like chemotaxis protein